MNNIKVRTKLTIVMIVSVLALVICTYLTTVNMNQLQTKALDVIEEDEDHLMMKKSNNR